MDLFHSSRIDMKQQLNAGVSNEVNSGSVPFSAVEPVQRCNTHESSTPTLLELNEILINITLFPRFMSEWPLGKKRSFVKVIVRLIDR